uniref:E3 ubiquitin-protein ligase n=1 Tax=Meloidogyne hapla TaxID=6305 RepID=A0A1I8B9X3_MELHA
MGSGYCDCGDVEAWSSDYFCKLHIPKIKQEEDMEEEKTENKDYNGLPPNLVNRFHHLSQITIKFAVSLLCWDLTEEFPSTVDVDLIRLDDELCHTILFNDETHTYEGVIRALKLAIFVAHDKAMMIASIVDRDGRSIVHTDLRQRCNEVKQIIEDRTRKEANLRTQKTGPLVVKVFRSSLSGLQLLAIRLINWLSQQAQDCALLAPIISEVLLCLSSECDSVLTSPINLKLAKKVKNRFGLQECLSEQHEGHSLYSSLFLLFDRRLWKAARTAFHQLIMSTVLMNIEHKYVFGRLLLENYRIVFEDFINDDHEHSVSITAMTVQIFTVPTIAKRLITDANAVNICMDNLRKFCMRYLKVNEENLAQRMDFSTDSYPAILRRALYMVNDVSYLLTVVPKPNEWTFDLRKNFVSGSHAFLKFLANMQGMDEVKRQTTEHQLMESEWETAFNIFLRLQEPLSLLLSWARTDATVNTRLFHLAMNQICRKMSQLPEFKERVQVKVYGHTADCYQYQVAHCPISIHQPLWRFVGGLLCSPDEILKYYNCDKNDIFSFRDVGFSFDELPEVPEQSVNLKGKRGILMEMPLRSLVLNAQIHNYTSNLCRSEMFDRDVQLLQAVGALMEPNKFIIRLLDRFGLAKWAQTDFEEFSEQSYTGGVAKDESSKIFSIVAEEMLHLLIMLFGERYYIGLSDGASPQGTLEREIIHILATGPKPFSFIEKCIPNDPSIQRLSLENAVRNVGNFKRANNVSSGQFYLKESLRSEYNPFFWHYSKQLASMAEQQQNKDRAELSREVKACPPPLPPPFSRFFAPILKIMESDVFIKLIHTIIERTTRRSRFVSDQLFYRAIFLLGMALNEQKRANSQGHEFNFIKMATKEGIFDKLERMMNKSELESHSDFLWWIVTNYKSLCVQKQDETKHSEKKVECTSGPSQKAAMAAKTRQLALERMRQLQNSFKTQNIKLIDSEQEQDPQTSNTFEMDDGEKATLLPDSGFPVCCGDKKSDVQLRPQPTIMCVLCQEKESISFDGNPVVCSAFVQNSRLFSHKCTRNSNSPLSRLMSDQLDIFSSINLPEELHISTCSHLMHFSCYNTFIKAAYVRENLRRMQVLNSQMLDTEMGEFFCPLCKRLSNCVMPVFPSYHCLKDVTGFSTDRPFESGTFETWFETWLNDLKTALFTQSTPVQAKGHSRKRSHSERSLAELAKSGGSSTQTTTEGIGRLVGLNIGDSASQSSVVSLPSSFDASPTIETEISRTASTTSRSTSPLFSISDAITGQIQTAEQLDGRGAALMHIMMQHVFGGKNLFGAKKIQPKEITQENVPPSIPHWNTLKPLTKAMFKIQLTEYGVLPQINPNNRVVKTYIRIFEVVNILKACAYLLRSIASELETENKPLFGAYNTRQRDCLNNFVRISNLIPFNCQPYGIHALVTQLLTPLLSPKSNTAESEVVESVVDDIPSTSSKIQKLSSSPSSPSKPLTHLDQVLHSDVKIMNIDMFSLAKSQGFAVIKIANFFSLIGVVHSLIGINKNPENTWLFHRFIHLPVELVICIGWCWVDGKLTNQGNVLIYKVADGSVDELYIMRLTLVAYLFQIIESFEPSEFPVSLEDNESKLLIKSEIKEEEEEIDSITSPFIEEFLERLKKLFPQRRWCYKPKSGIELYYRLHSATIKFLRPLAILYNCITLVPPPESLKDPSLDGFVPLCRYLGLPSTILEILGGPEVEQLFRIWSQCQTLPTESVNNEIPRSLPLKMNKLIDLPEDFGELVNMSVRFKCPVIGELTTMVPTLCLCCGAILCSHSYCCETEVVGKKFGACAYHLSQCHGSTGIFLRIRECQIFFLYIAGESVRGCFKNAPYVDEFGETDPGFRRGNPMRLNKELYWKIQRQWLHQEIAEEVLNQYELNHRNIAFDWQHF